MEQRSFSNRGRVTRAGDWHTAQSEMSQSLLKASREAWGVRFPIHYRNGCWPLISPSDSLEVARPGFLVPLELQEQ